MNWRALNGIDLNSIDLSDVGHWPLWIKLLLVLILGTALLFAGYFLLIKPQHQQLEQQTHTEQTLRDDFELHHRRAVNLDSYRIQLAEMRKSFGIMLRQLPDRTEVADVLADVSQTGVAAGLAFELFQPQTEVPQTFYAELPIKVRVTGSYHQFGAFVGGLAALPRIVTLHDVVIKPGDKQGASASAKPKLILEAVAKTYRYLGRDES